MQCPNPRQLLIQPIGIAKKLFPHVNVFCRRRDDHHLFGLAGDAVGPFVQASLALMGMSIDRPLFT